MRFFPPHPTAPNQVGTAQGAIDDVGQIVEEGLTATEGATVSRYRTAIMRGRLCFHTTSYNG